MASMDDVYGGNSLKAEDLAPNARAVLTVERVTVEVFKDEEKGEQRKLGLHFVGKSKHLLLNVTNANMMAEIAQTRDYDFWQGYQVLLYRTTTEFGGKRVPALRIDHATAQVPARPAPPPPPPVRQAPPPPPVRHGEPGLDAISEDDVPFSITALLPVVLPLVLAARAWIVA